MITKSANPNKFADILRRSALVHRAMLANASHKGSYLGDRMIRSSGLFGGANARQAQRLLYEKHPELREAFKRMPSPKKMEMWAQKQMDAFKPTPVPPPAPPAIPQPSITPNKPTQLKFPF
jgi:hypothetical protein